MQYDYLVVGAGLFGAVFANELTKCGKSCLVMSGSGEFAVLEPEKNTALWAALAGGAAVLAGIWAVLAGRKKKRGKSDAQAAEEGKESQETQTKEKTGESEEGPEETPRGEEKEQESRGLTQADRQEKGADSVGSNTAGEVGGD